VHISSAFGRRPAKVAQATFRVGAKGKGGRLDSTLGLRRVSVETNDLDSGANEESATPLFFLRLLAANGAGRSLL